MTKPTLPAPDNALLDRRAFLGGVGLAAAAALLPLSVVQGSEAQIAPAADPDGLWSVDVMCGHWPPYSHPIPYGQPQVIALTANLAPADHMFRLDYMLVS